MNEEHNDEVVHHCEKCNYKTKSKIELQEHQVTHKLVLKLKKNQNGEYEKIQPAYF